MRKISLLGFLIFCQFLFAQKPCDSNPKYSEFNFWVGEWDVYDLKNNLAGHSKISRILDNCVILEEWTSATPQNGLTFTG
ncbi:MAG: hypothetical protein V4548_05135 [Bacteroidota bacterium]